MKQTSASTHMVTMVLSLPITIVDFDEQKQKDFRVAIAQAAGPSIAPDDVSIDKVESMTSVRRRPLAIEGIHVEFSIKTTDAKAANTVASSLTENQVNRALKTAGLPESTIVQPATSAALDGEAKSTLPGEELAVILGITISLTILAAMTYCVLRRRGSSKTAAEPVMAAKTTSFAIPDSNRDVEAAAQQERAEELARQNEANDEDDDIDSELAKQNEAGDEDVGTEIARQDEAIDEDEVVDNENARQDEAAEERDMEKDELAKQDEAVEAGWSLISSKDAERVRVQGLRLFHRGAERPYKGVNGDYQRLESTVVNGRAVYTKIGKPTTAMWWGNNCWIVGPTKKIGESMWAYVESMNGSPEHAGTNPWTVYSFNSQSWGLQTGIEVSALSYHNEGTESGC